MVGLLVFLVALFSVPAFFATGRGATQLLFAAISLGTLGLTGWGVIGYGPRDLFLRSPMHPYAVGLWFAKIR